MLAGSRIARGKINKSGISNRLNFLCNFYSIYLIFNRDIGTLNTICRDSRGLRVAIWLSVVYGIHVCSVFMRFVLYLLLGRITFPPSVGITHVLTCDSVCPAFLINVACTWQFEQFGCFRKISKRIAQLRHVCPSVRPHGTTRLPLDGFS